MGFREKAKRFISLALGQVSGYMEIMMLKIKIIGFANKRSGLFTRLGEISYRSVENKTLHFDDERAASCIEEIGETGREIAEAEKAINAKISKYKADRDSYRASSDTLPEPSGPPSGQDDRTGSGSAPHGAGDQN